MILASRWSTFFCKLVTHNMYECYMWQGLVLITEVSLNMKLYWGRGVTAVALANNRAYYRTNARILVVALILRGGCVIANGISYKIGGLPRGHYSKSIEASFGTSTLPGKNTGVKFCLSTARPSPACFDTSQYNVCMSIARYRGTIAKI